MLSPSNYAMHNSSPMHHDYNRCPFPTPRAELTIHNYHIGWALRPEVYIETKPDASRSHVCKGTEPDKMRATQRSLTQQCLLARLLAAPMLLRLAQRRQVLGARGPLRGRLLCVDVTHAGLHVGRVVTGR